MKGTSGLSLIPLNKSQVETFKRGLKFFGIALQNPGKIRWKENPSTLGFHVFKFAFPTSETQPEKKEVLLSCGILSKRIRTLPPGMSLVQIMPHGTVYHISKEVAEKVEELALIFNIKIDDVYDEKEEKGVCTFTLKSKETIRKALHNVGISPRAADIIIANAILPTKISGGELERMDGLIEKPTPQSPGTASLTARLILADKVAENIHTNQVKEILRIQIEEINA